jgi:hypothetical protein
MMAQHWSVAKSLIAFSAALSFVALGCRRGRKHDFHHLQG